MAKPLIDGTARIRNLAGTVLLDLQEGPYRLMDWSDDEENADRTIAEPSPWMDGDVGVGYRLTSTVIAMSVRVRAASWAQTEAGKEALFAAVKAAPVWLLQREIEGVSYTWRAERPTSITSAAPRGSDVKLRRRVVNLRIPVQPSPAITGLPD